MQEMRTLLAERVKQRTHKWLEEGLDKGRREGEAQVLIRQFERKFGPLSDELRRRIESADSEQRLNWTERILSSKRLVEAFDSRIHLMACRVGPKGQ